MDRIARRSQRIRKRRNYDSSFSNSENDDMKRNSEIEETIYELPPSRRRSRRNKTINSNENTTDNDNKDDGEVLQTVKEQNNLRKRGLVDMPVSNEATDSVCTSSKVFENDYVTSQDDKSKKTIEESNTNTLKNNTFQSQLNHSSFSDFSDSGSEYKLSESSESESTTESSDDENIDNTKYSEQPKKNSKDISNYIMKPDDYFSSHATSKIVTSNHTLQKLKNPKLSEEELQALLTSCNTNETSHDKPLQKNFKYNCSFFKEWMCMLQENFNILLYGFGSKRNILKTFHEDLLKSSTAVVVNGYFPSLTIKDVVDAILTDVLETKRSSANIYESIKVIKKEYDELNEDLYLIVHNIDGPMLRNNKSQNVLSILADIPKVHLIASVDHINTPLIWDHRKMSKFNFIWWDVTSFMPYKDETSFESSMLIQRSGALALSSLTNVYQSLTKNAKGIFMCIVQYQLNNLTVKYYRGMPFKVLYSQCRENFLVSSDLALRTQLTEFLDHKLVKSKRTADGVEHLTIPIHNSLLQQFLEQLK